MRWRAFHVRLWATPHPSVAVRQSIAPRSRLVARECDGARMALGSPWQRRGQVVRLAAARWGSMVPGESPPRQPRSLREERRSSRLDLHTSWKATQRGCSSRLAALPAQVRSTLVRVRRLKQSRDQMRAGFRPSADFVPRPLLTIEGMTPQIWLSGRARKLKTADSLRET